LLAVISSEVLTSPQARTSSITPSNKVEALVSNVPISNGAVLFLRVVPIALPRFVFAEAEPLTYKTHASVATSRVAAT